jgi:RIO kinase 1
LSRNTWNTNPDSDDFDPEDDARYAHLEARFAPRERKRPAKTKHVPKKSQEEILGEIADLDGLEGGFKTTYTPTLFEQEWLMNCLTSFYDQTQITDVLRRVKGGKEANVYCCEAHPAIGKPLLAAKVYRPRKLRNLRNDKMYRQGRAMLDENGKAIKDNDFRRLRALSKNSTYGQELSQTTWLTYEYKTLLELHALGAAVPKAYGINENAILMDYIGDAQANAPTLHDADLPAKEAPELFKEVLRNIELMVRHGMIHGDLSAYNILYWQGKITLIDFPQVTYSGSNPDAFMILKRDVTRVCQYFAPFGINRDPETITRVLWGKFNPKRQIDALADLSARVETDED